MPGLWTKNSQKLKSPRKIQCGLFTHIFQNGGLPLQTWFMSWNPPTCICMWNYDVFSRCVYRRINPELPMWQTPGLTRKPQNTLATDGQGFFLGAKHQWPGDSQWPFQPIVGGHDSPLKGSRFLHPKKVTIAELPGIWFHPIWSPHFFSCQMHMSLSLGCNLPNINV